MSNEYVESVLDRLRQAYGLPTLDALAVKLGLDAKTFRVWATRKAIPKRVLADASVDTGRSVAWLRGADTTKAVATAEQEHASIFFGQSDKQVNLTNEERALLDNYRAASKSGRLAIEAASAALAEQELKRRRSA